MKLKKIILSMCVLSIFVVIFTCTAFSLPTDPGLPQSPLVNRALVKGFIDDYIVENGEITHIKHLGDAFSMGILDDMIDFGYDWEHPIESDLITEIIRNSDGDGNTYNMEGLEKVLRVYVDGKIRTGYAFLNPDQGGYDFTFKFDEPLDLQAVKKIRIECGYESDMQKIENSIVTKAVSVTFGATKYVLDGVPLEAESLVYNNTAYYPAAYLAQQLGCSTSWDAETNSTWVITGYGNNQPSAATSAPIAAAGQVTQTITATFGATKYVLNGSPLSEESLVYNGVAYYPAAYLAQQLGYSTSWDAETNITTVTKDAATHNLS